MPEVAAPGGDVTAPPARCAVASLNTGEQLAGTAPRSRSWLLIEQPGAWDSDIQKRVLRAAFGREGAGRVKELGARAGLRCLVIRGASEDRRRTTGSRTVLLGHADAAGGWLERVSVTDLRELQDLDMEALAQGRRGVGTAMDQPVYLVCTHGSRDACCAVHGRPVARALAAVHPELTWEVSHVGGHRFAGNLLIAPFGLYYGRLDPEAALRVAAAALRGRVSAEGLRGRSLWEPAGQWADAELRRRTGADRLDDVVVESVEPAGKGWTVTLAGPGGRWVCVVGRHEGPPVRSSCGGVSATHSFATYGLERG